MPSPSMGWLLLCPPLICMSRVAATSSSLKLSWVKLPWGGVGGDWPASFQSSWDVGRSKAPTGLLLLLFIWRGEHPPWPAWIHTEGKIRDKLWSTRKTRGFIQCHLGNRRAWCPNPAQSWSPFPAQPSISVPVQIKLAWDHFLLFQN